MDTLLEGITQDENNDGVVDKDSDTDGIPDAIEDGLDTLRDMLDSVSAGNYSGSWDVDGNGIENGEDTTDNRKDIENMSEQSLSTSGRHIEL